MFPLNQINQPPFLPLLVNSFKLSAVFLAAVVCQSPAQAQTSTQQQVLYHSPSTACVQLGSGGTADDARVVLHRNECTNAPSRIRFLFQSGGPITHAESGKCLAPASSDGGTWDGTPLVLKSGSACQQAWANFTLTNAGSLKHNSSGRCIHPENGSATPSDNTGLVFWGSCDEARLKFHTVAASTSSTQSTPVATANTGGRKCNWIVGKQGPNKRDYEQTLSGGYQGLTLANCSFDAMVACFSKWEGCSGFSVYYATQGVKAACVIFGYRNTPIELVDVAAVSSFVCN